MRSYLCFITVALKLLGHTLYILFSHILLPALQICKLNAACKALCKHFLQVQD